MTAIFMILLLQHKYSIRGDIFANSKFQVLNLPI